jgi:hypothetical protein
MFTIHDTAALILLSTLVRIYFPLPVSIYHLHLLCGTYEQPIYITPLWSIEGVYISSVYFLPWLVFSQT